MSGIISKNGAIKSAGVKLLLSQDSRPRNENIYMINEAEYNALQNTKQKAEYQAKLQRSISALNSGMGVEHELIEDYHE